VQEIKQLIAVNSVVTRDEITNVDYVPIKLTSFNNGIKEETTTYLPKQQFLK